MPDWSAWDIKPGHRLRLVYRVHLDLGPAKSQRKGFTETDYARLLDAAHQQPGGPIVLVWDLHTSRQPHRTASDRDPNIADHLPTAVVRTRTQSSRATRLKRMQYRPGLIEGLVATTGLDLQQP